MHMLKSAAIAAAALFLACAGLTAPAMAQAMVEGTWKSQNGSEIEIGPCDAGYCGAITKPAVSAEDLARYGDVETAMKAFVDEHNEDVALRNRPLIGLDILRVRSTNNPWYFEGEVYNPSDGRTYSGSITILGADAMMLKGCALFVFCREEQWMRVVN